MTDARGSAGGEGAARMPAPKYRPEDTFWPYVEPSEQLDDEELAALDPDLRHVLFGPEERPFSVTISFPRFKGEGYEQAVALARVAPEYREVGRGAAFRHRARYFPEDAVRLKALFEIVDRHGCEVLVDDQPVPYARELWLPLFWLLIPRRGAA